MYLTPAICYHGKSGTFCKLPLKVLEKCLNLILKNVYDTSG